MIKLNDSTSQTVYIIGLGGTGSHLLSFLSQFLGNFKEKVDAYLIDGDRVEEKNLKTQKFLPCDVGRYKSEVLAERYGKIYPTEYNYIDKYINSTSDITNIINRGMHHRNIIVSCVDNNKARAIVNDVFKGYDYYGQFISIDTGNSGSEGDFQGQTIVSYKKDKQIILPELSKYFPNIYDEEEENEAGCGQIILSNIQNISSNITSATTVFNILNNIIAFDRIPGDLFTFNATNVDAVSLKLNMRN